MIKRFGALKDNYLPALLIGMLFCIGATAQDIKVKQVIGAVHPSRPNIQVNGQSSFIPSWIWSLKTADAGMGYYDGKMLFYINDTLFAVGGYHGDSATVTTNKIFYSTNLGSTWSRYSYDWPYNIANVTHIQARYPGDWNYVFGSTDLLGSHTRTVTRFKNLWDLKTMTTTAEYGVKFGFGATTDLFGNIYVFGGQTEKLEGFQTKDVWMSTAQSGGANWTRVQNGLNWLGGDIPNSVVERDGYFYIMNARTTFNSDTGHTYSNLVRKIAVENILDSSKWITVESTPAYMDSMAYGTAAVYKGNIVFGLGSVRTVGTAVNNTNQLGFLDGDDHWHYLQNYIGADSTAENGVLQPAHATDMIVVGSSLITGFGAGVSNVVQLKDTSILAPHTAKQLSITKDFNLQQNNFFETILGNNMAAGTPHATNSYMKRTTSEATSYIVFGRNGERWWGMLDDGNSTANTDVVTTTGRKLYMKSDGDLFYYTNAAQSNYARISDGRFTINHNTSSSIQFKIGGTDVFEWTGNVNDAYLYSNAISRIVLNVNNTGITTIDPDPAFVSTTATGFNLKRGAVKLDSYGDGSITGTATYGAAFDTDGKLIEVALGGGGTYTNGYGLNLSGSEFSVDTSLITTRARLQHVVDSLGAIIAGSGGTPGGSNQEMQYNNSGSFAGAPYVKYDNATGQLKLLGVEDGLYINNAEGGSFASMLLKGGTNAPFQFGQYSSGGAVFFYNQTGADYTFNNSSNMTFRLHNATGYGRFPFGLVVGSDATTTYKLGVTGTLGVSSTSEFADNIKLAASKYLNWGTTFGSTGYGIRDNAGTMQFKNSAGSWTDFGSGGGGTTTNALTFNNSGTGDASGSTFDGSAAKTLSYNSIGAVPTTTTVNGHALSANVTVTAGDVGLGNVDNTSDATKNSATATLTNKRITKRTGTTASSATPTINTDNVDFYSITALAANITSFTTNLSGSPTEGQTLWIAITDNGTPRTLAFGTSFEASTVPLPTTTVASTRLDCLFVWNTVTSRWRIIACQ